MKKYVKIHIILFKNWKLLLKIIFDCMPNNTLFWNGFWGTNQLPSVNYVQVASNSMLYYSVLKIPRMRNCLSYLILFALQRNLIQFQPNLANTLSRTKKRKVWKTEHYKRNSKLHVSCCDMCTCSFCHDEGWKQPFRLFKSFLKYQLNQDRPQFNWAMYMYAREK